MSSSPIVVYTDHYMSKTMSYYFAKGSKSLMSHIDNFKDFKKTIAIWGYLRGTGELMQKVDNFFYMDHGYFKQSKRDFSNNKTNIIDLDGYFRIVYNNHWHDGSGNKPSDRFKKLNIQIKDIKQKGDYIILSEPTDDAKKFYNLYNWLEETKNILMKYTDRKIIRHNRGSKISLDDLLENAWAFVSDHSSAGFKSMISGVPAYFTNSNLKNIASLENIEKHDINYSVLNNLAYEQWTIKEILSGEAWQYLSKKI